MSFRISVWKAKSMSRSELIRELEVERERIRNEAERRMSALTDTIEVLRNGVPGDSDETGQTRTSAVAPGSDLSVPQMLTKAAQAMADAGKLIITQNSEWVSKATHLYPLAADKLKRGVYVAITSLVKQNVLKRVPGGLSLVDYTPKGTT